MKFSNCSKEIGFILLYSWKELNKNKKHIIKIDETDIEISNESFEALKKFFTGVPKWKSTWLEFMMIKQNG